MSPSPTPRVSVLTPSYNQATWLSDNLRSVSCQSYPDVEHIVMDGGSTDASLEVLSAAQDSGATGAASHLRWRSEPDKGQSDAINKAFRESTGEIIGWLNSDDAYFDCRVVADVVACFRDHPDVDVVYGHCLQITADGGAVQVLWAPPFDGDLLLAVNTIMQPATFIRRSALSDPMLDETFHFAMDYELWLRLYRSGRRFTRIPRFTAVDRHQSQRKSSTIKDVNESDLKRLETLYGTHLSAEYNGLRSRWYVRQRLMGAALVPGLHREQFAFTAPADFKRGLWGRQIFQRRSTWPAEYR